MSGFTNILLAQGGAGPAPPVPVTVAVTIALRPFTANIFGAATADTPGGVTFGVFNPDPLFVGGIEVTRLDSSDGFHAFEIWCPLALSYTSVDIDHSLGTFHKVLSGFNPAFGYGFNTVIDLWKVTDVGLTYNVTFNP